MRKIDFACHLGYDRLHEIGTTADKIVEMMDKHEVVASVLLPIGDGYIHRFREQNRELARIVDQQRRFRFFCTVNPWFEMEASKELEVCFSELGASGLALDTSRQGLYIDSPMVYPLIEIAEKKSKPVYFYTGIPIFALPLNLANLARRFPNVSFVMGAMGVSDYWPDIIPAMRQAHNILLETSVNTNVPAVLKGFVDEFGDRGIVFGTNFPFTDYEMEYSKIERAGLPPVSLERIFYSNAADILGLHS